LALLAESLWARTEPAEPPPTMMMSYTFGISLGCLGKVASVLGPRQSAAGAMPTSISGC
jgi:hypothetical protein